MLPGFAAEVGVSPNKTYIPPYRDGVHAGTSEVWPQQRAGTEGPDRADAVQTCTCPCCIRYHGTLVCC